MHDRFVALLELISSAHTLSDIERAFQSIREIYGLANVIYHAVRIPGMEIENPILLLTCDPQWIFLYMQRDYFRIDPVVKAGCRGFLPIDWLDVDRSSPRATSSPKPIGSASGDTGYRCRSAVQTARGRFSP